MLLWDMVVTLRESVFILARELDKTGIAGPDPND